MSQYGIGRSATNVAGQRKIKRAAHAVAVDCSDSKLRRVHNFLKETLAAFGKFFSSHARECAKLSNVCARSEDIARAREDDCFKVCACDETGDGSLQLFERCDGKLIALCGTVEADYGKRRVSLYDYGSVVNFMLCHSLGRTFS